MPYITLNYNVKDLDQNALEENTFICHKSHAQTMPSLPKPTPHSSPSYSANRPSKQEKKRGPRTVHPHTWPTAPPSKKSSGSQTARPHTLSTAQPSKKDSGPQTLHTLSTVQPSKKKLVS